MQELRSSSWCMQLTDKEQLEEPDTRKPKVDLDVKRTWLTLAPLPVDDRACNYIIM